MPNFISFVLPCEAQWVEGIYQIEYGDRILGYDPETGLDGKANQQGLELGNRTLYLKELLDKEHIDGKHSLTNDNFITGTQIPEDRLNLDYSTSYLNEKIQDLVNELNLTNSRIGNLVDVNLSYYAILNAIIPYSQEYFNTHADYELFNDNVKLTSFRYTYITKEIAGDDSLDVASTAGLVKGKSYFLMDPNGNNLEEVTILDILTEHRVRFTTDLQYTRNTGYLTTSTVIPDQNKVTVKTTFSYLSDLNDTLLDSIGGRLYVHRDPAQVVSTVKYLIDGETEWQTAEYLGYQHFYDGTEDDIFRLPNKCLKLKVEYKKLYTNDPDFNIYYLVIKGLQHHIAIEYVRRPVISDIERQGNKTKIIGNTYGTLFGIKHVATEVKVTPSNDSKTITYHEYIEEPVTEAVVNTPINRRPLNLYIRYIDAEGTKSRWSVPYTLE